MNNNIVPISDLNTFVSILTAWHEQKVKVLEHMLSLPEGTEAELGGGGSIVLEGNVLQGFQIGLSTALIELGHLPFIASESNDDNETSH